MVAKLHVDMPGQGAVIGGGEARGHPPAVGCNTARSRVDVGVNTVTTHGEGCAGSLPACVAVRGRCTATSTTGEDDVPTFLPSSWVAWRSVVKRKRADPPCPPGGIQCTTFAVASSAFLVQMAVSGVLPGRTRTSVVGTLLREGLSIA
jgi:hypothetical protein